MLWLIVFISFMCIVSIFLGKDSWLNREFEIYKLVSKYPYLVREFIKDSYKTFK